MKVATEQKLATAKEDVATAEHKVATSKEEVVIAELKNLRWLH